MVKAIRGAIQINDDTREDITDGVYRLFQEMISRNSIPELDIVSLIISQTDDLHSYNPAAGLRSRGVDAFPLFCLQELKIDGQLPRTIRFLMHINYEEGQSLSHVYLDGASVLRPDLA